jgi:uncharacterized protein
MSVQPDENRLDELAVTRNGDERFTKAEGVASGGACGDGKPTLRTFTGRYVHPLNPTPDEIDIADISHSLSNQCRFSGHVSEFYSVGQHSVHVADEIMAATGDRRLALWGLLHDASEAYLVDLPKPLKMAAGFGEFYRQAETDLMTCICFKFHLPLKEPEIVRHYDKVLVCTEARDFMGRVGEPWYPVEMLTWTLESWTPELTRTQFQMRYRDLTAYPNDLQTRA